MSTAEVHALETESAAAAEQHEIDYRQAVVDTAGGDPPHPDELRAILYDAGRSRANFEQHLEVARRRYEATQMIDRCAALAQQIDEIEGQRSEIESALARLREDYQAAVAEPLARSAQLQQQRLAARRQMSTLKARALADLRATRPAAWDAQLAELSRRAQALRSENESDRRQVARLTPNPERVAQLEGNLLSDQEGAGTLTPAQQQELATAHRALEQIDALQDALHQRSEQLTQVEQALQNHQDTLFDWRNIDF